ncbi:uncharacterized protein [Heliangelus exortis]|uniref:uncharacterized protein isoform X5 n=1 Tax=Heliangelus exortis TaxID=472823 RepID=UPI003A8F08FA
MQLKSAQELKSLVAARDVPELNQSRVLQAHPMPVAVPRVLSAPHVLTEGNPLSSLISSPGIRQGHWFHDYRHGCPKEPTEHGLCYLWQLPGTEEPKAKLILQSILPAVGISCPWACQKKPQCWDRAGGEQGPSCGICECIPLPGSLPLDPTQLLTLGLCTVPRRDG